MTYQNQQPQGGQSFEKNPNGGYLNKSKYGDDSWYGKVTITPELLAEIQRTGHVSIQVKDVFEYQYGPARRVIAKPYVPAQQGQGYAAGQGGAAQPPAYNQAPVQAQPQAAAPQQGVPIQQDEIPW